MTKVKEKVVWITGASSGIGEALVYELAKKGSKLILSARNKERLEEVKGKCTGISQQNIQILPLDLSQPDTLELSTDAALQFFGHIDILINSGGISQRALARETVLDVDRKVMEVNFFGSIALTKYLLPSMLERKSGHFVSISSLVGKFGSPYRTGYAASKHALHGFYDSLRAELWKDDIKVMLVCPGFIHTQISVNALTEDGSALNQMDDAQANGMPAEKCAQIIIKGIEKNKNELLIGGKETLGVYIKRFFPGLFAKIIRKAKVR
ncbi:MAG: SDR family oxidoreductase [Cyclobacteriaceae bacterium]|nr:SDR family oxidoreductase [Cyclobacteriaceae bacterium]